MDIKSFTLRQQKHNDSLNLPPTLGEGETRGVQLVTQLNQVAKINVTELLKVYIALDFTFTFLWVSFLSPSGDNTVCVVWLG